MVIVTALLLIIFFFTAKLLLPVLLTIALFFLCLFITFPLIFSALLGFKLGSFANRRKRKSFTLKAESKKEGK